MDCFVASLLAMTGRERRRTDSSPHPHDSLRLLRSLSRSSASSCAIASRWLSRPSLWRRASLASSAAVSAMKAAASSGPPSPFASATSSWFRDFRFLPEAMRFRPPPILLKKPASELRHPLYEYAHPGHNSRTHFATFQIQYRDL